MADQPVPLTVQADSTDLAIESISPLPNNGRVVAVVIGIETYKARPSGGIPGVQFAKADAEAFAKVIQAAYPGHEIDVRSLLDQEATQAEMVNEIKSATWSLDADDLFVFYYAGHGYYDGATNRLTAWDSRMDRLGETTFNVAEHLLGPVSESPCERVLVFIDACHVPLPTEGRRAISDMDTGELQAFLQAAKYAAVFCACKPGEESYPSTELKHGVWTHYLLEALSGKAPGAVGPHQYITGASLQDYLAVTVPRYITNRRRDGQQTPNAFITATNTFAIRHVPPPAPKLQDAAGLSFSDERLLEGDTSGRLKGLPTWHSGLSLPSRYDEYTRPFWAAQLQPKVTEEIQEYHRKAKAAFRLKSADLAVSAKDGGSLDAPAFRFSIEADLDPNDLTRWRLIYRLTLRQYDPQTLGKIDETFGHLFKRFAINVSEWSDEFSDIISRLEDIEADSDGDALEEAPLDRVAKYKTVEGVQLEIDYDPGLIVLGDGARTKATEVLKRAHVVWPILVEAVPGIENA